MKNNKYQIQYEPYEIYCCSLADKNDVIVYGKSLTSTTPKSFLHYFSIDNNSNDHLRTKNFVCWDYSPSTRINSIIVNEQDAFLASSTLEKISLEDYQFSVVDDSQYIKPLLSSNNEKIFGMVNYTGVKIFDLNKHEGLIIYPGKKNLVNDYIIEENKIVMCTDDHKLNYYDLRDNKTKFSIKYEEMFDLLAWGDNNYNLFYAYSCEGDCLYKFDYRKLNQTIEETKKNINIKQMLFCSLNGYLYLLEDGSNEILLIKDEELEKKYECGEEIDYFNFNKNQNNIIVLKDKKAVEIVKNI